MWRVNTVNITYVLTVNYVGLNWRCMGVWRVNSLPADIEFYVMTCNA